MQRPVLTGAHQLTLKGAAEVDVRGAVDRCSLGAGLLVRELDAGVGRLIKGERFEEGGVRLHADDRIEHDPGVAVVVVEPIPELAPFRPQRVTPEELVHHPSEFPGPSIEPLLLCEQSGHLHEAGSHLRGQLLEVLALHPCLISGVVPLSPCVLHADDATERQHQSRKRLAGDDFHIQIDGVGGDVCTEGDVGP